MFALAMSKSFRRLCSALTKEQTQSLENVQRWALQIIFCNSPCGLSFGTLQRSSLCDRRRELCESSFRQIVRDESHVLHYLLPAKRVTHFLLADCKQQRHFHYSTRGQGLKTLFCVPTDELLRAKDDLLISEGGQSLSSIIEQVVQLSLQPNKHSFSLL